MDLAIDSALYVRPTGHRLLVALGIAAILVVLLLTLLAGFRFYLANAGNGATTQLTVYIEKREPSREVESTPQDPADTRTTQSPVPTTESLPADAPKTGQDNLTVDATEQPIESAPVRDWQSMAQDVVRSQLNDEFRQDAERAQMWRQSPSVMFRPGNSHAVAEIEPVLPDVPFKPEIHVFGLGFTIGSCFFGIPLVGIPVEERTVGPTLIYCASR